MPIFSTNHRTMSLTQPFFQDTLLLESVKLKSASCLSQEQHRSSHSFSTLLIRYLKCRYTRTVYGLFLVFRAMHCIFTSSHHLRLQRNSCRENVLMTIALLNLPRALSGKPSAKKAKCISRGYGA